MHFWHYLEGLGFELNKETFSKYWGLSEAVAGLVLPEINIPDLEQSCWLGKEIEDLQKELISLWENRDSFEDFLKQSLKIAEKFENSKSSNIAVEFK